VYTVSSHLAVRQGSTHKGDRVVEEDEAEADETKVKEVAPVVVVRLLRQLVVGSHDTDGSQVRQDAATEDHEDVLRDEPPRRVAGTEERRLPLVVSRDLNDGLGAYVVLEDIVLAREAINGLEERSGVHGGPRPRTSLGRLCWATRL
jgi:hypothetical protein